MEQKVDESSEMEEPKDASSTASISTETKDQSDCYHYTKNGEFTSEIFKICVDNLPHYVGYQQMRKTFSKLNVTPRKLKFDPNCKLAFMTFSSEEEREAAIKAINGFKFKKHILSAKKAMPKPDPQLRKRQIKSSDNFEGKRQKQEGDEHEGQPTDDLSPEIRLKYVVTKLCDMPYSEQLKVKFNSVADVLRNLDEDLAAARPKTSDSDESSYKLEDIIQSPVLEKYRNKVEFNIGPNTEENITVGFRLGTYKDDNFAVVEPTECINVSDEATKIAKIFQDFIQGSSLAHYDPGIHTGYWRQLTVRNCISGEIMVIVQVHPQNMNQDDVDNMKKTLIELFSGQNEIHVSSLYLQLKGQGQIGQNNSQSYIHLSGKEVIYENMLDLQFQISPDAFFQVNTPAAEKLYSKIREWCDITEDTTVLDICCGTGTIGLFLAKAGAKKVIGIELCQQAIEDAKKNAALNGITNTEFICGKAEDALPRIVHRLQSQKVVAVVDPPRAGLHKKVILALRSCLQIRRLVFVACDAKKASTNFLDLCRPTTNRNKGDPYNLLRAVPVDLFPHTAHCESILLMERFSKDSSESASIASSSNIGSSNTQSSSAEDGKAIVEEHVA
ncbi:tRNA (uracil-5-)-methyltransferase homolog A-like [Rhopilema esculentum]|uniref:tRNA (uracil-5-)-methyltransferase homolog A-like n=1 Tax=Rhopilema esculentum TaxID=499914 RepID=UPI0031D63BA1